MALDLGTLTGYLELNDGQFDSVIDKMPDKLKGSGVLMGVAAGAVAVGVGAALSNGLNQAIELDDARHKITAQLGLTEEESARIGGVAGTLFTQAYGESVEDVNTAVANVVSSIDGMRGATEESLEAMTAKALNFASAFEIDTARSTQVVGQLIKTGLVADANEGFDLLTASMQKVPAAVREDIMDAADEYGPFMQTLGLSGQEAFDLLVRSSEKGMYGIDKAGDALKEFTIRSTDMSKASGDAYAALGLDQEEYTNKLLAGGDTASEAFQTILTGLQGIEDPAARSQAALALFGTPLEDLGVNEIPSFLASLQDLGGGMEDAAGAADRMGQDINGSAKVGWEQLSRTWDSIVGQLGSALLPILTEVINFLNEHPAVLQIVAGALGILAAAFIGVSVATWAMNTALLANPITWIILAIVALIAAIVALVMNWDAVVAWISEVWSGFISWITGVIDGFIGWWNGVWEGFASWIGEVWSGFVGFITDVWNGFISWVMGVVDGFVGWWNDLWAGVGAFFASIWEGFVAGVTAIWQGFVDWIIGLVIGYVSWWYGIWNGVASFFANLWSGIVSGVSSAWQGFINWIMGVVIGWVSWWYGIWRSVASFFASLWQNIVAGVQGAWNGVINWMRGIPGWILGIFSGAVGWLLGIGRNIMAGLRNGVTGAWSGVIGFIQGIPGSIMGFFSNAGSWLRNAGRWILDGLLGGLKAAWNGVTGFIGGIGDWIANNKGPESYDRRLLIRNGGWIMSGLGVGLEQGFGDIRDQVHAMAGEIEASFGSPTLEARVPGLTPQDYQTAAYEAHSAAQEQPGVTVDARTVIHGNVGWDKDELERESQQRQRDAMALYGVSVVGEA